MATTKAKPASQKTPTVDVTLNVNGKSVALGYEMVEKLLDNLNYSVTGNKYDDEWDAVFNELAKHPSSAVREAVANMNCFSKTAFDILIEDKNSRVLEMVLENEETANYITAEQIEALLKRDELQISLSVLHLLNRLGREDDNRLDARSWYKMLVGHSDPRIRYELAGNYQLDKALLKKLAKDEDACVAKNAQDTLGDL